MTDELTAAEIRALRARDKADSDTEAAQSLGLTVNTLRSQLANARSKLGVKSTHKAIRKSRRFTRNGVARNG